jgi:hypothetical protein
MSVFSFIISHYHEPINNKIAFCPNILSASDVLGQNPKHISLLMKIVSWYLGYLNPQW